MIWTEELFHTKKPIIAMLHLDPLPGDPLFTTKSRVKEVVDIARKDLIALQAGGVDGILFSNEFSLPYERKMSFVTPSTMARVIGELMNDIKVPFGVDCISDGLATLELAAAVEASFVRGTFCGVYVGDGGFYNNDFSSLLRRKAALHLDNLKMLYFLNPESDINLDPRPLSSIAKSVIFKAGPDGLCISAQAAGEDVNGNVIKSVVDNIPKSVPVFCNTGCRIDTVVEKLHVSNGGIVGTTFKKDGLLRNHIEEKRVHDFMEVVKDYRNNLCEN